MIHKYFLLSEAITFTEHMESVFLIHNCQKNSVLGYFIDKIPQYFLKRHYPRGIRSNKSSILGS